MSEGLTVILILSFFLLASPITHMVLSWWVDRRRAKAKKAEDELEDAARRITYDRLPPEADPYFADVVRRAEAAIDIAGASRRGTPEYRAAMARAEEAISSISRDPRFYTYGRGAVTGGVGGGQPSQPGSGGRVTIFDHLHANGSVCTVKVDPPTPDVSPEAKPKTRFDLIG
jgi:hypothetical protein